MEGNSPKTTETGFPEVWVLKAMEQWLEQEAGISRPANAIRALVMASLKAVQSGHPLPLLDRESLRAWVKEIDADTSQCPASKWLPKKELVTWWDARSASRNAFLLGMTPGHRLNLRLQDGGGRGNVSQYGFIVSPAPETVLSAETVPSSVETGEIDYDCEPAKSALWLRWLLPPGNTRLRSWRGPLIALFALGSMAIIPLLGLLILIVLEHAQPLRAKDLQLLLFFSVLGYGVYRFVRPWWELPQKRITIASDFMLASTQLHGQIQLVKDRNELITGSIALQRHYGSCSRCGGTVDLYDGGREFPGRIIGRCRDSPTEHLYSFDPVSRRGISLR
jgi:hypothetical protein